MSTLTYDHVCDPTSMFQDSFSLSEFILGPQEEECMQNSLQMLQKNDIKEELDSEEEYQNQLTMPESCQDVSMSMEYSPCSYVRQQSATPHSPSSSSGCSGSSPTGYQPPPMAYHHGNTYRPNRFMTTRNIASDNLPYAVYMGYRSRDRKRDDDLPYEEREKRRLRRERNKQAALRCRTRRRERIETLEKEVAEIEAQNKEVETDITCLQAHLKQLQQMLSDHTCTKGIED